VMVARQLQYGRISEHDTSTCGWMRNSPAPCPQNVKKENKVRSQSGFYKGTIIMAGALTMSTWCVPAAWAADGKALFESNCVSCHGATGKGDGAAGQFLNPKPADLSQVAAARSEADITKVIKDGGAAVGKSPLMTAFGSTLTDEDIKAIVSHIRKFGK